MSDNLKKLDDVELWGRWQNYIAAAGRIKQEIDRRQKAPKRKFIKRSNKISQV